MSFTKKENKRYIRWAITGVHGLYTGQYLTRFDAIKDHTIALDTTCLKCKAKGDRAVKVEIKLLNNGE
jgi:hypothetical protein